jgi:hypothetical protein
MEWSGLGCRYGSSTFEQIFQFVIVTSIQPTDRGWLLRALQLAPDIMVLGTAVRFDPKPDVSPELPLGAKTMRCLQDGEDECRPDRADEGNLAQQFCCAVFGSLGQQIASHVLAQRSQHIELLIRELREHRGCAFLEGLRRILKTLLQKGRPFILRPLALQLLTCSSKF